MVTAVALVATMAVGSPSAAAAPRPGATGSTAAASSAVADDGDPRPRTIITQDGEIDDMDSLVRFLYYSNEVDLEGIVYSSSRYHYRGDPEAGVAPFRWTGTEWLDEYIDEYEQIYPNLVKHAEGFPTPDHLRSIYKIGNVDNVSEMTKDTEGSEFLEQIILDDGDPVHVQTWGGLNTLARALKAIQDDYSATPEWPALQKKISEKLTIYNILNQDATLADYIRPNWPDLKIIDNQSQFWSFAYQWARRVPAQYQYTLQADYMVENFLTGHGELLEGYHSWGDGQAIPGENPGEDRWSPDATVNPQAQFPRSGRQQYDFISEGDSPSYMYLFDFNGLRQRENVSYGGWGGRFDATTWLDTTDINPATGSADRSYPQTRWVEEIQDDWAARADWGVTDYSGANHIPQAAVAEGLDLTVYPGKSVTLHGSATDPDGDDVALDWWQYKEAGTFTGDVTPTPGEAGAVTVAVPADAEPGTTIHLILDAQDDGAHTLVHHQRVIITVGSPSDGEGIPVVAELPELGGPEGALTLSVADFGAGLVLTGPTNVGDRLRFDGALPAVTVTDTRNATQAGSSGWSVVGRATAFTSTDAEFSSAHLGWTPWATALRDGVTLGVPVNGTLRGGPGLATPATLVSAPPASRLGIATTQADLRLEVPVDTPEGVYRSQVTVSLFPVD
ncbi:nucleoside hydrolase-like domain-containing protein [Cellulomonas hominis]